VFTRLIHNVKIKTYLYYMECPVYRVCEYGRPHGIVPACAGFLRDIAAVVEDMIKGTSVNQR
jgi:hypothetical protein